VPRRRSPSTGTEPTLSEVEQRVRALERTVGRIANRLELGVPREERLTRKLATANKLAEGMIREVSMKREELKHDAIDLAEAHRKMRDVWVSMFSIARDARVLEDGRDDNRVES